MVFKIVVTILAILGLVFVIGPFFNYAVFNSQCGDVGCDSCAANRIYEPKVFCKLRDSATAGCEKDCKVRNFKCGFDEEFKSQCIKCVQDCKVKYTADSEFIENCYSKCRNSTI